MENLIIILSALLETVLVIALAIYMKRFNFAHKEYKNVVKENIELDKKYQTARQDYQDTNNQLTEQKQITVSINKQLAEAYESKAELIQKCNRQYAEIESLQSINSTLLNDNRKLSDELQELKNKPFDPLKELDNLTIRKDENKTPEAKKKPKTKKGLKINYPDKNDFRNNV